MSTQEEVIELSDDTGVELPENTETTWKKISKEEFEAKKAGFQKVLKEQILIRKEMFILEWDGDIFKDYEFDVEKPVGEGGFGRVY